MRRLLVIPLVLMMLGCSDNKWVQTTEVIQGSITSTDADNFNEGAAVVGYMLGRSINNSGGTGLLWGVAGGAATAQGCKVRVLLDAGGSLDLKAPSKACHVPSGTRVTVVKYTNRLTTPTGEVTQTYNKYAFQRVVQ